MSQVRDVVLALVFPASEGAALAVTPAAEQDETPDEEPVAVLLAAAVHFAAASPDAIQDVVAAVPAVVYRVGSA